jgi:hypothetical protein
MNVKFGPYTKCECVVERKLWHGFACNFVFVDMEDDERSLGANDCLIIGCTMYVQVLQNM